MIAFEMMFLLVFGVVAVVTIASVGRPLAEAYAEKAKARYRELEPEAESQLKKRLTALESEVIDLRRQVTQIQENADFAAKMLEGGKPETLEIKQKQKSEQES